MIINTRNYLMPDWPAPKTIRAYTTTRQNGVSTTPFNSFNLANYVGDNPTQVNANINTLIDDLQLPEIPLWLHQVHGNSAVCIDEHTQTPDADASFTKQKNKVCAVLTADCLPILVCNRDGTEVCAIHAGWKGLLENIIEASVNVMHSSPDDLIAWMGPALSQQWFELGDDVYADFLNANPDYANSFQKKTNRWHLDPYTLGRLQLQRAGVNAIYGGDFCTFNEKDRFYSFRRDKGKTGRMASLIFIEG